MNSHVRRLLTGIFSLLFLAAAGFFWLTESPDEEPVFLLSQICARVSVVLFFTWMMWKYLEKMPPWMFLSLPIILISAVINLKLLGVTVPLAGLLAVLSRPIKKKKRK